MSSFVVNICLDQIDDKKLTLRLILGSPAVFALVLILVAYRCPESFRYHLMPGSRNYSPEKAYASLQKLRNTKVKPAFPFSSPLIPYCNETELGI